MHDVVPLIVAGFEGSCVNPACAVGFSSAQLSFAALPRPVLPAGSPVCLTANLVILSFCIPFPIGVWRPFKGF